MIFNIDIVVISFIGGSAGGLIVKVVDIFCGEWLKEKFAQRKERREHELFWLDKVVQIYTEGGSCNWNKPPGDVRHIKHVVDQVERFNSNLANRLRNYLKFWLQNLDNIKYERQTMPPRYKNDKLYRNHAAQLKTISANLRKATKNILDN